MHADTGCNKESQDGNTAVAADVALWKKLFNFLLNYDVAYKGNGADITYMDAPRVLFWKVNTVFYEESLLCMGQIQGDVAQKELSISGDASR